MTTYDLQAAVLLELGCATLGESGAVALSPRFRPAWPGARLAAPAFTATCSPGDNLAIHVAVAEAPAGHALVAVVGDEPDRGYWGEVLTTAAQARDLRGLVIEGGVRDTEALERLGFPAFSTVVALRGATKEHTGTVGAPVVIDGVEIRTGDHVIADRDGVVVVPGGRLDEVLDAARARRAKEEDFFRALRSGSTTLDLLALDASKVSRA